MPFLSSSQQALATVHIEMNTGAWEILTSINLRRLHVFARHIISPDDFRQPRSSKVLFTWLLFAAVLARISLKILQTKLPPTKLIVRFLIELAGLLADFEHPVGRQTEHLGDAADLVVFGGAGKERKTKEEFHNDTA